jgi:hypothetical protein
MFGRTAIQKGGEMFLLQHDKICGRMDNKTLILNDVAALIWHDTTMGKAKDEIVSEIMAKYEVDRKTADEDLRNFISTIKKLSLSRAHKPDGKEEKFSEFEVAGQRKKYCQPKIHIYDVESDEEGIIF